MKSKFELSFRVSAAFTFKLPVLYIGECLSYLYNTLNLLTRFMLSSYFLIQWLRLGKICPNLAIGMEHMGSNVIYQSWVNLMNCCGESFFTVLDVLLGESLIHSKKK